METLGFIALALMGFGLLGLVYAFSGVSHFDSKGPSTGFGGTFFAVSCGALVLIAPLLLATIGVAQVFFA